MLWVRYHVEIEDGPARYLLRLARGDKAAARRITAAIDALAEHPRPANGTKLVGSEGWRIRVGDYRVIYAIDDSICVVAIVKIGHRRDIYER